VHAEVVVNFRESERGSNQERVAALDGVLGRGTARFDGSRWSVRGESAVYRHRGLFVAIVPLQEEEMLVRTTQLLCSVEKDETRRMQFAEK